LFDQESDFGLTSAEISSDLVAHLDGPGYATTASIGRFGQVGLDVGWFSSGRGFAGASVLVASDEFVNLGAVPARVRTQFIVDGGDFFLPFATDTRLSFRLEVGAQIRGPVDAINDQLTMESEASETAEEGALAHDGFAGGGFFMNLSANLAGAQTYSTQVYGGLDLHATHDVPGRVQIPLSVQSLDLGVLLPGHRLLLAYRAAIGYEQDGFSEGATGRFSDPFALMSDSIRSHVTLEPVPEPALLAQVLSALLFAVTRLVFIPHSQSSSLTQGPAARKHFPIQC
jgi:hypothetical protein